MRRLGIVFLQAFLCIAVKTSPIEDEINFNIVRVNRWPTDRALTWKLDYDSTLFNKIDFRRDLQQAFDDWARYTPLTFREVTDDQTADFHLVFVSVDLSRGVLFDGSGGKVSHSFPPGHQHAGYIYFDISEQWSHTYDGVGYNIRLVAAHEIGSSLGLAYSNDSESIMSSSYRLFQPNKMLPTQDQQHIQALYGKRKGIDMKMTGKEVLDREKRQSKKRQPTEESEEAPEPKKKAMEKKQEYDDEESDEEPKSRKKKTKKMVKGDKDEDNEEEPRKKKKETKKKYEEQSKKTRKSKKKKQNDEESEKLPKTKKKQIKKKYQTDDHSEAKSKYKKKSKNRGKSKVYDSWRKLTKNPKTKKIKDVREKLHVFPEKDAASVIKSINELVHDDSLKNFSEVSNMINKAIGGLPDSVIPVLVELARSHMNLSQRLKTNLADSCSVLSNFVVKSYRVMKRGASKADKKALSNFSKKLKGKVVEDLQNFVKTAQFELIRIANTTVTKAQGQRVRNLLDDKDRLEQNVSQKLTNLKNAQLDCDANEVKVESLRFENELIAKAGKNAETAHKEFDKEITSLKERIPEYEQKLMDHRNSHLKEYSYYWIFTWRVYDIHRDNGESIARENLNRLLERIRDLERQKAKWPDADLDQRKINLKDELKINELKTQRLREARTEANKTFQNIQQEFNNKVKELSDAYKSAGTNNLKTLELIDELSRRIYSGALSILTFQGKVETALQTISADFDLLSSSAINALDFMNKADAYIGSSRIKIIKQSLGVE